VNPLLLVAAAAQDPPLIDLDYTVFVQLVLFIVTALFLTRFLFRPYLGVQKARQEGIEGSRDEARRLDEESRARLSIYETSLGTAKARANAERTKHRLEATEREREILDAARGKTQGTLEASRATLAREATATRAELAPRADEIAREMARKILGREIA
jgi:F-type H+-transporting ATPase subunit b